MRRGVVKLRLLQWQRRETLETLCWNSSLRSDTHTSWFLCSFWLKVSLRTSMELWDVLLNSHPTWQRGCRHWPDSPVRQLSASWISNEKVWLQCEVKMNTYKRDIINKNSPTEGERKQTWGIQRQRMLRLFFHARQRTGACWELMNHINVIEKKQWKRKYANSETSDRESHLFGGWHSISLLRTMSAGELCAILPSDTLWHQDKGAVLQPCLCQPLCHNLATLSALKNVQQNEKADWWEVRGSLCVYTTRNYSDSGQGKRISQTI